MLNQTINIIVYFSVAVSISLKASFLVLIFGLVSDSDFKIFSSKSSANIEIEVYKI